MWVGRRLRHVFDIEVPGQHSGTDYRCAGCGGDYGSFTLGCRQCRNRHGWRRRKGTLIRPAVAPTKRTWFRT